MSQVISYGYGKENFTDASVSLLAFYLEAPFIRVLPSRVPAFKRSGTLQTYPSSNYPQVSGYLYLDTIIVPDGSLFLFQASHKYRGAGVRDGAFIFHARHDGPMSVVRAALPPSRESLNGTSFVVLQGRGDIISPEEAKTEFGIEMGKAIVSNWFNAEEIDECYTFSVTQDGTQRQAQDRVTTADGKAIAVPNPSRTRRMKFRGGQ